MFELTSWYTGVLFARLMTPPTAPLSTSKMKISTPAQPSSPARVTTKAGRCSRVIRVPWKAPMSALAASPTMTPAHQGQLLGFEISAAVMAAPTAPTKPTDRSISLRMRAYSSAMPSRMMKAAWTNRLTMFAELKNALDFTSKMTQMTIRPMMIGIAPLSPPRMRSHQARR